MNFTRKNLVKLPSQNMKVKFETNLHIYPEGRSSFLNVNNNNTNSSLTTKGSMLKVPQDFSSQMDMKSESQFDRVKKETQEYPKANKIKYKGMKNFRKLATKNINPKLLRLRRNKIKEPLNIVQKIGDLNVKDIDINMFTNKKRYHQRIKLRINK